jgi:protein-L-isoaspartate O-methyltransferase
MVNVQLVSCGIRRHFVQDAMRAVRRKFFVDRGLEELAYEDGALPIGESQNLPALHGSADDRGRQDQIW